jgi:L-lactate dehydrogenase complex protein LldG
MPLLAAHSIPRHNHASLANLPESEQRAIVLAAGMGITSVELAIAETGTLLMWSQPGQERVASLVPPVHVAIVDEAQIVPDLFDAFALLEQRGGAALPSNLALITGPSKTGDIELELTTGVHGPKHWHVIVIRRPSGP